MASAITDYTTKEAGAKLGMSDSRVRRVCIQHNVGTKRGRDRFLTDADIRTLKKLRRPVGRPRKDSSENSRKSS